MSEKTEDNEGAIPDNPILPTKDATRPLLPSSKSKHRTLRKVQHQLNKKIIETAQSKEWPKMRSARQEEGDRTSSSVMKRRVKQTATKIEENPLRDRREMS